MCINVIETEILSKSHYIFYFKKLSLKLSRTNKLKQWRVTTPCVGESWHQYRLLAAASVAAPGKSTLARYLQAVVLVNATSGSWKLTVATVHKVGPNDHFLRETEHPQSAALERRVENVSRVGHHVFSLEDPQSDQTNFGTVKQQPPVGHLFLPANVSRILPQQFHLQTIFFH